MKIIVLLTVRFYFTNQKYFNYFILLLLAVCLLYLLSIFMDDPHTCSLYLFLHKNVWMGDYLDFDSWWRWAPYRYNTTFY